jgi:hypothetical protein
LVGEGTRARSDGLTPGDSGPGTHANIVGFPNGFI